MSGMDQIWGQTRNLADRIFDPLDLSKRRSGRRDRLWHPDMGTDTMSGIPIRKVQRETFNSQLSMGGSKERMVAGMWGQTRLLGPAGQIEGLARCPVWTKYGDRHGIWPTGFLTR